MIAVLAQTVEREPTFVEQITPMLTLVVAVLALVGVWLGQWLARRLWLREQRLRAYTEVLDQAHVLWELAQSGFDVERAERHVFFPEIEERMMQLYRVISSIDILGPGRVAVAAERVRDVLDDVCRSILPGLPDTSDVVEVAEREREKLESATAKFTLIASRVIR